MCNALTIMDSFLERHGATGDAFLFDEFSLAEVMTLPFMQRLLPVADHFGSINILQICEEAKCNRFAGWLRAGLARASVVATAPPRDDLIKAYSSMRERLSKSHVSKG